MRFPSKNARAHRTCCPPNPVPANPPPSGAAPTPNPAAMGKPTPNPPPPPAAAGGPKNEWPVGPVRGAAPGPKPGIIGGPMAAAPPALGGPKRDMMAALSRRCGGSAAAVEAAVEVAVEVAWAGGAAAGAAGWEERERRPKGSSSGVGACVAGDACEAGAGWKRSASGACCCGAAVVVVVVAAAAVLAAIRMAARCPQIGKHTSSLHPFCCLRYYLECSRTTAERLIFRSSLLLC
mmetsp:Transcript_52509/g.137581  ORF Transcript_52509/g.137581 Transcript_52509/m.137581 type:complete len:235 (-) Transcript_52509:2359-3063(-)